VSSATLAAGGQQVAWVNQIADRSDQIAMTESLNVGMRLAATLKADVAFLLYLGPPFIFGWYGTRVIAPILWWAVLAMLALFSEYRPDPHYNELRSRPIAFGIALVAFLSIYFAARWLSPH
jgi:hypothetical protein